MEPEAGIFLIGVGLVLILARRVVGEINAGLMGQPTKGELAALMVQLTVILGVIAIAGGIAGLAGLV